MKEKNISFSMMDLHMQMVICMLDHMLNKVIKDVICRYKNMEGFYTPYIPGWDTHGLPIENAIQKQGVDRKSMSTANSEKNVMHMH